MHCRTFCVIGLVFVLPCHGLISFGLLLGRFVKWNITGHFYFYFLHGLYNVVWHWIMPGHTTGNYTRVSGHYKALWFAQSLSNILWVFARLCQSAQVRLWKSEQDAKCSAQFFSTMSPLWIKRRWPNTPIRVYYD